MIALTYIRTPCPTVSGITTTLHLDLQKPEILPLFSSSNLSSLSKLQVDSTKDLQALRSAISAHLRRDRLGRGLLRRLGFSRWSSNRLGLGGHREVLGLNGWLHLRLGDCGAGHLGHLGRRKRATVVNVLLGLGAVVTQALLHQTLCMGRTLASKFFQLIGLLMESLLGALNLGIDQFAVADVNERTNVDDGGGEQRQSPEWEELDEEVGNESSRERL